MGIFVGSIFLLFAFIAFSIHDYNREKEIRELKSAKYSITDDWKSCDELKIMGPFFASESGVTFYKPEKLQIKCIKKNITTE